MRSFRFPQSRYVQPMRFGCPSLYSASVHLRSAIVSFFYKFDLSFFRLITIKYTTPTITILIDPFWSSDNIERASSILLSRECTRKRRLCGKSLGNDRRIQFNTSVVPISLSRQCLYAPQTLNYNLVSIEFLTRFPTRNNKIHSFQIFKIHSYNSDLYKN